MPSEPRSRSATASSSATIFSRLAGSPGRGFTSPRPILTKRICALRRWRLNSATSSSGLGGSSEAWSGHVGHPSSQSIRRNLAVSNLHRDRERDVGHLGRGAAQQTQTPNGDRLSNGSEGLPTGWSDFPRVPAGRRVSFVGGARASPRPICLTLRVVRPCPFSARFPGNAPIHKRGQFIPHRVWVCRHPRIRRSRLSFMCESPLAARGDRVEGRGF